MIFYPHGSGMMDRDFERRTREHEEVMNQSPNARHLIHDIAMARWRRDVAKQEAHEAEEQLQRLMETLRRMFPVEQHG